jgi:hypothetical protein
VPEVLQVLSETPFLDQVTPPTLILRYAGNKFVGGDVITFCNPQIGFEKFADCKVERKSWIEMRLND